jgi:16S rRNA (adenine1518-N6/adenine1519-N6)-dimethyltransferase
MSIIDLLRKYDIHPIRRFGQNFLVDPNIKGKLIEVLPRGEGKPFVEIGPGLGAITEPLLRKGEHVISIEIDKKLQAYLENELAPRYPKNFELIKGDVLEELGTVLRERAVPVILIGNLPYYISSPILFQCLKQSHLIEAAFFTLQKEVANRLIAKPGTKDYGRLSASFGRFAKIKKIFDISPGCFSPKPDVWSTFIKIEFKEKYKDADLRDEYMQLVKVAFSERRKQLTGLLSKNYGLKAKQAEDCMIRLELSPNIRAEQLSPSQFWKLLDFIHRHKKKV